MFETKLWYCFVAQQKSEILIEYFLYFSETFKSCLDRENNKTASSTSQSKRLLKYWFLNVYFE